MKLLEVNHLSAKYSAAKPPVIDDISFDLSPGEVLVIFGKSGSGKTTLLKCLAGLIQPTKGEILLEGKSLSGPKDQLVPGHEEVKLVFQDFNLKNKMTVAENIHYMLLSYTQEYRDQRVSELIDLCGLQEVSTAFPEHLSGGQKQRLALARALANEPKILLMDEPFSNLDSITKGILFQEIKRIVKHTRTSVIFVSHDARDALSFADNILVLEEGKVSQLDPPHLIYKSPVKLSVAQLFGELNKINGLYYRLEDVVVTEKGQLEGVVSDVMYFGSHQLLIISWQGQTIKSLDFLNQYHVGDKVYLNLNSENGLKL